MQISVTAMSGAGNDFLIVEESVPRQLGDAWLPWVERICRRGVSIGADGVIGVSDRPGDRVAARFLNPDGSEAFCGNGSRCVARWATLRGWVGDRLVLETEIGDVPAVVDGDLVELQLERPTDHGARTVTLDGQSFEGRWITAGIPHFVLPVDDPGAVPIAQWGRTIRFDPQFGASGTNVNFVSGEVTELTMRTYERGVEAETLCCGSGAVAAAFATALTQQASTVRVVPRSGIAVEVTMTPDGVTLRGEARRLFETTVHAEATAWPG